MLRQLVFVLCILLVGCQPIPHPSTLDQTSPEVLEASSQTSRAQLDAQATMSQAPLSPDTELDYLLNPAHTLQSISLTDYYWDKTYTLSASTESDLADFILQSLRENINTSDMGLDRGISTSYDMTLSLIDANTFEEIKYTLSFQDNLVTLNNEGVGYWVDSKLFSLFKNFFPMKPYEVPGNIESRIYSSLISRGSSPSRDFVSDNFRVAAIAQILCERKEASNYQNITHTDEELAITFTLLSFGEELKLHIYETLVCVETPNTQYWYSFTHSQNDPDAPFESTPGVLYHLLFGAG